MKNNAPGLDKIEYIHLKLINKSELQVVYILVAVRSLVIANCEKKAKQFSYIKKAARMIQQIST